MLYLGDDAAAHIIRRCMYSADQSYNKSEKKYRNASLSRDLYALFRNEESARTIPLSIVLYLSPFVQLLNLRVM